MGVTAHYPGRPGGRQHVYDGQYVWTECVCLCVRCSKQESVLAMLTYSGPTLLRENEIERFMAERSRVLSGLSPGQGCSLSLELCRNLIVGRHGRSVTQSEHWTACNRLRVFNDSWPDSTWPGLTVACIQYSTWLLPDCWMTAALITVHNVSACLYSVLFCIIINLLGVDYIANLQGIEVFIFYYCASVAVRP